MNIGDKLYLANDTTVDTYIVDAIINNTVYIHAESVPYLKTSILLESFESGKLVNLFTDYDKALERSKVLAQESEARKQKYYEQILDDALNSVTLEEVIDKGELLKSKKLLIETEDALYLEALLYNYENKRYVIVYKYFKSSWKECVKFYKYDN